MIEVFNAIDPCCFCGWLFQWNCRGVYGRFLSFFFLFPLHKGCHSGRAKLHGSRCGTGSSQNRYLHFVCVDLVIWRRAKRIRLEVKGKNTSIHKIQMYMYISCAVYRLVVHPCWFLWRWRCSKTCHLRKSDSFFSSSSKSLLNLILVFSPLQIVALPF